METDNNYENYVTPERRTYFMNYLTELGFDRFAEKQKVYLFDQYNTGFSMHLKRGRPNFSYILLNDKEADLEYVEHRRMLLKSSPEKLRKMHRLGFYTTFYDGAAKKLTIDSTFPHVGFRKCQVDAVSINLVSDIVGQLDSEPFQGVMLPVVRLGASKWSAKFDDYRRSKGKLWSEFSVVLREIVFLVVSESFKENANKLVEENPHMALTFYHLIERNLGSFKSERLMNNFRALRQAANMNISFIQVKLGNFQLALQAAKNAVAIDQSNPKAHMRVALALERVASVSEKDLAVQYLKQAIEIARKTGDAFIKETKMMEKKLEELSQ